MRPTVSAMLLLLAAAPLAAQSPAMLERIDATMNALNGTPEEYEAYAQRAYSNTLLEGTTAEQRRDLYARIHASFGDSLRADSLVRLAPTRVRVRLQGSSGAGNLLLDHETAPPHRLTGLALEGEGPSPTSGGGARRPRPGAPLAPPSLDPGMEAGEIASAVGAYMRHLAEEQTFSGALLIARHGQPVFQAAYGLANRADRVPNTAQTRFNVGSINKQLTRVAIAQLAAAGKLRLDDPLGRYLADHANESARRATLRQLLTHRAGLADWGTSEEFRRSSKALYRSNRDFYRLVAPKPLDFEPGSREQYCNSCYVVLGEVIERLSGVAYERYVEQNVLARAGMATAGFFQTDDPVPRVAVGYTSMTGDLRSNVYARGAGPNAAGGAFATPADLLAFENAIRDGTLLDAEWTAWFLGSQEPPRGRAGGGLTLGGGGPGVSSMLRSDGTWTVVAMANLDSPAGSSVARALFEALTGR